MLDSLGSQNLALSKRLFQWIAFAYRPLTLAELCVAVSLDESMDDLKASSIISDPQSILKLGGHLISHDSKTNQVAFVHYTVQQFLISSGGAENRFHLSEEESHIKLARLCLKYLQFDPVSHAMQSMKYEMLTHGHMYERELSFTHYAVKYWTHHAKCGSSAEGSDLWPLVSSFFFGIPPPYTIWQGLYERPISDDMQKAQKTLRNERERLNFENKVAGFSVPCHSAPYVYSSPYSVANHGVASEPPQRLQSVDPAPRQVATQDFIFKAGLFHPMHYLARFGLSNCIIGALELGVSPDVSGGLLDTSPLHEAAKIGSAASCRALILFGAMVDKCDILGRTPLFYACRTGNAGLIQLLLDHGAKTVHTDWYNTTVLHEAIGGRNLQAIKLLLQVPNLAVDAADSLGDSPLLIACRLGEVRIARLLMERGATPTEECIEVCLLHSSEGVLEFIAKSFVPNTSQISVAADIEPLLHRLCYETFNPDFMGALIDRGYPIDLRFPAPDGPSALRVALQRRNWKAAKYLLSRGASCFGDTQESPCRLPVWRPYSSSTDPGGCCFHLLLRSYGESSDSEQLRYELMRIMIKQGCPVDSKGATGCTALWSAMNRQSWKDAHVLLDFGASYTRDMHLLRNYFMSSIDMESYTSLVTRFASASRHRDERDEKGRTPLLEALGFGNLIAARLYLIQGAVAYAVDSAGEGIIDYIANGFAAMFLPSTGTHDRIPAGNDSTRNTA